MARSKAQENAMALDPQRQMIAKNMSVLPGGPENNNPMNVTDNASPPIQATSIYGDYAQNYQQMGTGIINPMNVGPSGLVQFFPMGRGKNASAPYGMQMQPDSSGKSVMPDMMESSRLSMNAQEGVPLGQMGYQGMPAVPGAFPSDMGGTSGPPLMPGMQSVEDMASMVPGSTPQKVGQKKKGGKK